MSARTPTPPKKPLVTWLAYRVRGAKAALLGHVQAATMEEAIAAAAAAYGLPTSRIIVQAIGH